MSYEIKVKEDETLVVFAKLCTKGELVVMLHELHPEDDGDDIVQESFDSIIEAIGDVFPTKIALISSTDCKRERKWKQEAVLEEYIPLVWDWCNDYYQNTTLVPKIAVKE